MVSLLKLMMMIMMDKRKQKDVTQERPMLITTFKNDWTNLAYFPKFLMGKEDFLKQITGFPN